jgi:hypothetical protein
MDGNLSELLKNALGNPETAEKLMGAAQRLLGDAGRDGSPKPENPPAPAVRPKALPAEAIPEILRTGNAERIALIAALRPYLSSERQKTADSLLKMLKMMKLADLSKLFSE